MNETLLECDHVELRHGPASIALPRVALAHGQSLALRFETIDQAHHAARLLVGFDVPTTGFVRVLGQDTARAGRLDLLRARRALGYAASQPAFLSTVPLPENVVIPLRDRMHAQEVDVLKRSTEFLAKVGVVFEGRVLPQQASPAVRYLCGLARALASEPALAIVEEPPAMLTAAQLAQVRAVLHERAASPAGAMLLLVADTLAGSDAAWPSVEARVRHE